MRARWISPGRVNQLRVSARSVNTPARLTARPNSAAPELLLLPELAAAAARVSLATARAIARAVIPAISESSVFIAIASTFSTREVFADAASAQTSRVENVEAI